MLPFWSARVSGSGFTLSVFQLEVVFRIAAMRSPAAGMTLALTAFSVADSPYSSWWDEGRAHVFFSSPRVTLVSPAATFWSPAVSLYFTGGHFLLPKSKFRLPTVSFKTSSVMFRLPTVFVPTHKQTHKRTPLDNPADLTTYQVFYTMVNANLYETKRTSPQHWLIGLRLRL